MWSTAKRLLLGGASALVQAAVLFGAADPDEDNTSFLMQYPGTARPLRAQKESL
jgi:hypothetical protein